MHRERGIHLDEPEVTVDGAPIPASTLGTALTLFYVGREQAARGQGIYFYLPKLESAEEAALYRDLFDASRAQLDFLRDAVIKAIPLIESLPAAYQMEEMLYALGPYAAGFNAARWDFKASIFEYAMADPNAVWPDRFGVDIKTTPFSGQYFPTPGGHLFEARGCPHRRHGDAVTDNPDPEVNRTGGGSHPGRQGVGGTAGVYARLGGPHLPHEDGGRSLQRGRRLGLDTDAGDGQSGQLSRSRSRSPRDRSRWRARAATPEWSSNMSRVG